MKPAKKRILDHMRENSPNLFTVVDLSTELDIKKNTVRGALLFWHRVGKIERVDTGLYREPSLAKMP
jgi:predicted transcriptional regulator of viral defense system